MTPRDSMQIVAAALRWSTAYERRRAAGAEKRLADLTHAKAVDSADLRWRATLTSAADASRRVTELKRQERAAMRVLAKVCAKYRSGLQELDVFDTVPARARLQVVDVRASIVERA